MTVTGKLLEVKNPFKDYCTITPFKHGTIDWLNYRRQGVTASDIPILLGSFVSKTPLQLFVEKKSPPEPLQSRQMEFGLHNERLLLDWAAQDLGAKKSLLCNWLLVSKAHPYLMATIDAVVQLGEICVPVELKTAVFGSFEDSETKLKYYHQVQTQMLVTGSPVAYLAILPAGNASRLIVEAVYNDPVMQARILRVAADFKNRLDQNIEPPAVCDDLANLHYNPDAANYNPDTEFLSVYDNYRDKVVELDAMTNGSSKLEKEIKSLKARLAQLMGGAPKALFTWKNKEVLINRTTVSVEQQIRPAYSYSKINIKEKD